MPEVRTFASRIAHLVTPFNWRDVLLCLPGFALCLTLSAGFLARSDAIVASGAAFTVALGANYQLGGYRWGATLAAIAAITLAAFVGTLAGEVFPLLIAMAALGAAMAAYFGLTQNNAPWWISVQMVIALLVAGSFHNGVDAALHRASFVALGGMLQLGAVMVMNRYLLWPEAALAPTSRVIQSGNVVAIYLAQAALCVAASIIIANGIGLPHGYWAPMSALLVLKPGRVDTQTRGLARFAGTIGGSIAASLVALAVQNSAPLLVAGAILTAGAAFGLRKAHYIAFTFAVTATMVLLMVLVLGGAIEEALDRVTATLIGGGITLLVTRIYPLRLP